MKIIIRFLTSAFASYIALLTFNFLGHVNDIFDCFATFALFDLMCEVGSIKRTMNKKE
jgi:hypothetical protein